VRVSLRKSGREGEGGGGERGWRGDVGFVC
jgi:hypothetical protein